MLLRALLLNLLLWVLYPTWLLAGAVDYLCHRRTAIGRTSGATESWFHVAQFACLALVFAGAVFLQVSAMVFALLIAGVVIHSVLAFADVAYTDGKRYISPLEQHAHSYMDVIPLVAIALIGALNWPEMLDRAQVFALRTDVDSAEFVLLVSFLLLTGVPIIEELTRTLRARRSAPHIGFATMR
jgi:hypothetical protein